MRAVAERSTRAEGDGQTESGYHPCLSWKPNRLAKRIARWRAYQSRLDLSAECRRFRFPSGIFPSSCFPKRKRGWIVTEKMPGRSHTPQGCWQDNALELETPGRGETRRLAPHEPFAATGTMPCRLPRYRSSVGNPSGPCETDSQHEAEGSEQEEEQASFG